MGSGIDERYYGVKHVRKTGKTNWKRQGFPLGIGKEWRNIHGKPGRKTEGRYRIGNAGGMGTPRIVFPAFSPFFRRKNVEKAHGGLFTGKEVSA